MGKSNGQDGAYTGLIGGEEQVVGIGARSNHDLVVMAGIFGGSVTTQYHSSALGLLGYEMQREVGSRRLAKMIGLQGLYVANNRQNIASRFFDGDSSTRDIPWLLQMDADIEFPHDFLDTMLGLAYSVPGCKVLAMNVPLGKYPTSAFEKTDQPGVFECIYPLPPEPVFPQDAAATAIFLIHRDVLAAIADQFGQCWFNHSYVPFRRDGDEETMRNLLFHEIGEDIAFCTRAATVGYQTYIAHGAKGVYHHKSRPLSEHGQIEESLRIQEKLASANADPEVAAIVREGG